MNRETTNLNSPSPQTNRNRKQQKYRLGIVSPVWKRPELTMLFLKYYSDLSRYFDDVELVNFCVYSASDPFSHLYYEIPDWIAVGAPNVLSNKVALGFRLAKRFRCDGAMYVPSDDFLSYGYLREVVDRLAGGHDYVAPDSMYLFRVADYAMLNLTSRDLSPGKAFSARLLNEINWQPVPDGLMQIDKALLDSVGPCPADGYIHCNGNTANAVIDVKVDTKLTPFEIWQRTAKVVEEVDARRVITHHFPNHAYDLMTVDPRQ